MSDEETQETKEKSPFLTLGTFFRFAFTMFCILVVGGTVGLFLVLSHYSEGLPDHQQLADYNPNVTTRLYASDGQMLAEYAKEKRLFVPIEAIPKRLVNAFIAAEDQNFYHHPGVDFVSVIRAMVQNIANYGTNRSLVGGSTITQQVVKNFLLTNERSLDRKIKEAILAFRITEAFPKDRIMELYLNEIYLGNRSYGVAAAALNYFNKSLSELTIEEAALLAALPKAPSNLDPSRYPEKARERRDWVIGRMREEGFIDEVEALLASEIPITLSQRQDTQLVNATFFTDAVKQNLIDIFSQDQVETAGMAVRTTLNPVYQGYAEQALMQGLRSYDRRHGWRGAIAKVEKDQTIADALAAMEEKNISLPSGLRLAAVTSVEKEQAFLIFADASEGVIALEQLAWAQEFVNRNQLGPKIESAKQVLSRGDIVAVSKLAEDKNEYTLEQLPEVNGAIVAMNPHTGQVLAMVGGYDYGKSQFNRATQAMRQPGSAFKPFVYLAALENGYVPNSIIVDEEIQLDRGEDVPEWRPQNHSGEYYGSTTLRIGMEKSRNAMTVRLAKLLGISHVVEITKRLGIINSPPRNFSLVLGAVETDLLSLTNAYAMLVNGGKRLTPALIERIQNKEGHTIFKRDDRICQGCVVEDGLLLVDKESQVATPPILLEQKEQVIDPINAYQMVSMLEGVITRGTGRGAKKLGKTLAGKTGTTNDSFDAWFMGFSADLVVGVYAGFDTPKSLGRHEYGSSVALPIWREFIRLALQDKSDIPFRRPEGIKLVKIDSQTGQLPSADTQAENIIFEAFKAGTEPTSSASDAFNQESGTPVVPIEDLGAGGVY